MRRMNWRGPVSHSRIHSFGTTNPSVRPAQRQSFIPLSTASCHDRGAKVVIIFKLQKSLPRPHLSYGRFMSPRIEEHEQCCVADVMYTFEVHEDRGEICWTSSVTLSLNLRSDSARDGRSEDKSQYMRNAEGQRRAFQIHTEYFVVSDAGCERSVNNPKQRPGSILKRRKRRIRHDECCKQERSTCFSTDSRWLVTRKP
jgi:hypothetical protein